MEFISQREAEIMTIDRDQHCQVYKDNYFELVDLNECHIEEENIECEEYDDWKRLARYIGIAILFFYVLFKYLI